MNLFLDCSDLDVPQFIVSPRGHYQLVDSRGFIYSKERTIKSKTHWECTYRSTQRTKYSARLSTIDLKIVKYSREHNHLPPPSRIA